MLEPTFVVLDEPTSALDMLIQAQMVDLLCALQKRHDLTYMFISHDLRVVAAMSSSLMVMKDGKVVETGPAAEIVQVAEDRLHARAVRRRVQSRSVARGRGRAIGSAMSDPDLSDSAVEVELSGPENRGGGFYRYERYRVTLDGATIERDCRADRARRGHPCGRSGAR